MAVPADFLQTLCSLAASWGEIEPYEKDHIADCGVREAGWSAGNQCGGS